MGVIDFTKINRLLDRAENINSENAWIWSVDDNEVKAEIIHMNTNDQLYEQGIDSTGKSLGQYAPMTVVYKRSVGERYDHVTLFDTGEFYRSWSVRVTANGFTIDANDVVSGSKALFDVYGENVLGLTDENMEYLKEIILERYKLYLYEHVFRND